MVNKKPTKVTKKMAKKTTEEVPEDDGARIIDGGSQDQGRSQTQERVVGDTKRSIRGQNGFRDRAVEK